MPRTVPAQNLPSEVASSESVQVASSGRPTSGWAGLGWGYRLVKTVPRGNPQPSFPILGDLIDDLIRQTVQSAIVFDPSIRQQPLDLAGHGDPKISAPALMDRPHHWITLRFARRREIDQMKSWRPAGAFFYPVQSGPCSAPQPVLAILVQRCDGPCRFRFAGIVNGEPRPGCRGVETAKATV